jgi:hypothetical protein
MELIGGGEIGCGVKFEAKENFKTAEGTSPRAQVRNFYLCQHRHLTYPYHRMLTICLKIICLKIISTIRGTEDRGEGGTRISDKHNLG